MMKLAKGKLNPGFILIVFSLLTGSHVFAQNLLKNPGFETGVLSPFWGTWPAGENATVAIDTNHVYAGNFCANISSQEGYLFQPVNLEPNTTYKISAAVKTEASDVVYFGVTNVWGTTGVSLVFTASYVNTDSLVFTTGDNIDNNSELYLWKGSGAGGAWIDDLKLTVETTGQITDEPGGAGVYYVSPAGNDNNTGTSPQDAWQTIEKINGVDFEPGDSILFEGSHTFYGNIRLKPNDSGSQDHYLHIGSFGTGSAEIDAGSGTGLLATDCRYLSIKNLNFKGAGRKTGNSGDGLFFSFCADIMADSIEVSGFQHSGVIARNVGHNYYFTHIYAHNNGYAGIFISGIDKNSLSDIYIGHCIADNNPGDPTVLDNHSGNGIFAYQSKNIIIEYCKASNNGWDMPRTGNGPGGIWVAEVDSAIIQYCISHDNKTSVGGQDGLGFDLDGGITNSVIQYCLSYNNQGAGFGIFQYENATEWNNNTIRYCISENDGNVSAGANILIWNGSRNKTEFQGLEFYNNVIYNSSKAALAFYDHYNSDFNFRNNIFVSKTSSVYNRINGENFQGNCWYTITNNFHLDSLNFMAWVQATKQEMLNSEIVGIYANPNLINPGNSTLTDPTLLQTVDDYKVLENSVVTDAGLDLDSIFNINPGNQDYFGNSNKQGASFDMGIYEYIAPQEPDNKKPVVTSFQITETSSTLVVPVSEFSATDNIAVTGYKVTETAITPLPNDTGWSAFTPLSYTFDSDGTKTLYAWAKDAAGNVSASVNDQVTITLPAYNPKSLGNTEVYRLSVAMSDRRGVPVTFSEAGEIQSISIYHNGSTGNVLLGVYSDLSGLPFSRLGVTASTLVNPSAGWQTVSLTTPLSVSAGQTVWLAWVFQNSTSVRYAAGKPGRALSSAKWPSGMPETFGTAGLADFNYSVYCTYRINCVNPSLNVSPSNVSIDSETGSSGTFNITSNTTWNITDDANWLDVSPASGSNNGVITIMANSANSSTTSRTATVTIGADGVANSILTVTQEGQQVIFKSLGNTEVYSLSVAISDRRGIPVTFSEAGEIQSISIYHNGSTGNVLLGLYSDLSGLPFSRLGVTASTPVNPSAGWQTVSLTTPLAVSAGQTVWLAWVFQNNTSVRYAAGKPGRALSSAKWPSGMPDTFGTAGLADFYYSVYCTYRINSVNPSLNVSPSNVSIDSETGSSGTFNITSNTTWNITDDANWLDVSPASGSNNGVITVTSNSANSTIASRTATVAITADGVANSIVTVTQEGQQVTFKSLGNTDVYSLSVAMSDRRGVPVTFSEAGEIQSISIYHNGSTGNVLLGVYSNLSGLPSSRLGVTASTPVNPSAGWQTVSFTTPLSVSAGQTVWLAWVFQNSTGVRYVAGKPGRALSSAKWSSGMPDTFGTAGLADFNYSVYCTYSINIVNPSLHVSPSNISIASGTGSSGTINITSNTTWNITDDANWMDVSPASSSNNGVITVSANSANSTTASRTATVTITADGVANTIVIVTQEGQQVTFKSLGNTEVYSLSVAMSDRRGIPVTFSEAAEIQSISIYHNGSTGNILLGVYSDLSGLPSSRLGVTVSTPVNPSAGWQTVSLTSPLAVSAGQTVWLAWVFQNSTGVRYAAGTPGRALSTATWTAGMPTAFGTAGIEDFKYSIYCTYSTTNLLKDAVLGEEIIQEPVVTFSTDDNSQQEIGLSFDNFNINTKLNDFKLYPNPSKSFINVEFSEMPEHGTLIEIIDSNGRVLYKKPAESITNRIDISNFPIGLYFVRSINHYNTVVKKLIVKNN